MPPTDFSPRQALRHMRLLPRAVDLDALAEAELFGKSRHLIGPRTAVLISHRFSIVRMADCIYVLNRGRLVESGSHAELLQQNGYYSRMHRTQSGRYVDDSILATD